MRPSRVSRWELRAFSKKSGSSQDGSHESAILQGLCAEALLHNPCRLSHKSNSLQIGISRSGTLGILTNQAGVQYERRKPDLRRKNAWRANQSTSIDAPKYNKALRVSAIGKPWRVNPTELRSSDARGRTALLILVAAHTAHQSVMLSRWRSEISSRQPAIRLALPNGGRHRQELKLMCGIMEEDDLTARSTLVLPQRFLERLRLTEKDVDRLVFFSIARITRSLRPGRMR